MGGRLPKDAMRLRGHGRCRVHVPRGRGWLEKPSKKRQGEAIRRLSKLHSRVPHWVHPRLPSWRGRTTSLRSIVPHAIRATYPGIGEIDGLVKDEAPGTCSTVRSHATPAMRNAAQMQGLGDDPHTAAFPRLAPYPPTSARLTPHLRLSPIRRRTTPSHHPPSTIHHPYHTYPMGNLCGKQSKDDNFQGAGRTLGAAPTPATKASVPARIANDSSGAPKPKPKVSGPGRTVGGASGTGEGSGDPKAAAAAAAEVRTRKAVKPMMTTVWM